MRSVLAAAAGAALLLCAGCSVMLDPEGVDRPSIGRSLEACVAVTGGHAVCGGQVSAGGEAQVSASGGHRIAAGVASAGAAAEIGTASGHEIRGGFLSSGSARF